MSDKITMNTPAPKNQIHFRSGEDTKDLPEEVARAQRVADQTVKGKS